MANSRVLQLSNGGKKINLLLIGMTGNGKSATGNSILGAADTFKISDNQLSCTMSVRQECAIIDDLLISVVDGPGLKDNRLHQQEDFQQAMAAIDLSLILCHEGLHAIILVLNFSRRRFTKEDIETIALYKAMLGENVYRDHCICVVTHGEYFLDQFDEKSNHTDEQLQEKFMTYVRQQEEQHFRTFAEEINYRFLLFRNSKRTTQNTKVYQRERLFQEVQTLFNKFGYFDHDIFKAVRFARNEVTEVSPNDRWKADLEMNISIMLHCLKAIESNLQIADGQSIKHDVKNFEKIAISFLSNSTNSSDSYVNDMRTTIDQALQNLRIIRDGNRDRRVRRNVETHINEINNKREQLRLDTENTLRDLQAERNRKQETVNAAQQKIDRCNNWNKYIYIPLMAFGGLIAVVATGGFAFTAAAGITGTATAATGGVACRLLLGGGTVLVGVGNAKKNENKELIENARVVERFSNTRISQIDEEINAAEKDKKLRKQ